MLNLTFRSGWLVPFRRNLRKHKCGKRGITTFTWCGRWSFDAPSEIKVYLGKKSWRTRFSLTSRSKTVLKLLKKDTLLMKESVIKRNSFYLSCCSSWSVPVNVSSFHQSQWIDVCSAKTWWPMLCFGFWDDLPHGEKTRSVPRSLISWSLGTGVAPGHHHVSLQASRHETLVFTEPHGH